MNTELKKQKWSRATYTIIKKVLNILEPPFYIYK